MHESLSLVGQGWLQLGELVLAFVLSATVGLEREIRQKSAGLRTYSLVGVSAALFMLISKYGFNSVLVRGVVILDPSRVAAQVVSGIGFIGGGVIFMRRNVVRGLTTAASVWLTAAVGMASGAGLVVLAITTTGGYFLIMLVFPRLVLRYLPQERRTARRLQVLYEDRRGLLAGILLACSELRFAIDHVEVERARDGSRDGGTLDEEIQDRADLEGVETQPHRGEAIALNMQVKGKKPVSDLIARLSEVAGVLYVGTLEDDSLD